jgi:hypothetical protein
MGLFHRTNYMDLITNIERSLFPRGYELFWHNDENSKQRIMRLIDDLKILFSFKDEIDEKGRKELEQLYKELGAIYWELKTGKNPVEATPREINQRLEDVAKFFKMRYAHVTSNSLLRRLYRKFGCEKLFGRGVEVHNSPELKGPAIIAFSHHPPATEAQILQALCDEHIFFFADLKYARRKPIPFNIRLHDWPVIKQACNGIGLIEVNLTAITAGDVKGLKGSLQKAIAVLEHGRIVGMAPHGWIGEFDGNNTYNISHTGVAVLAKLAEKVMKRKIPIIPVGVVYDQSKISVNFGNTLFIPNARFDEKSWAMALIKEVDALSEYAPAYLH